MSPTLYHFAGRVREAVRSPRLLLAGLACGATLAGFDARLVRHVGHSDSGPQASLLYWVIVVSVVGGFASVIGSGATTSPGQGRSWSTRWVGAETLDWAHPPLPLGPRSRILAEALAAVGLILLWRAVLEPAYLLLPRVSWLGVSGFVRDRFIDACVILPCVVAWLSPSRARVVNGIRRLLIGSLVVAWSLVASRIGAWSWGVMALLVTAALLQLSEHRFRFTAPFRGLPGAGARFHGLTRGALVRHARTPASQLRRDFWLGPPTANLTLTLVVLLALAVDAMVYAMSPNHVGQSFVSGLAAGLWMAFLTLPLGVSLLGRQGRSGGTPLFGGWFVAAWSPLPIRRDALLRAVYAHGLIWGCCLSLFSMTFPDLDDRWLMAPVGLAASASVAGALVCVAAGDRWRGVLSMGAAALALAAIPLAASLESVVSEWFGTVAVAVAVAAVAGGLGGLPPLVHMMARAEPRGR